MAKSILQPLTFLSIAVFTFLICWLLGVTVSENTLSVNGTSLIMKAMCISFLIHGVLFIPSYLFQTEKFYDLTGSVTYVTTIGYVVYEAYQQTGGLDIRTLVIAACIMIWTLRLGSFLFWRVLKDGEDKRFRSILPSFTQLLMTWALSAAWVFIQSLSALVAITVLARVEFGVVGYIGLALWVFGFLFEVLADHQKTQFKANPTNDGKFINEGLWTKSRHPNYFGEMVLWFGVSIMSVPVMSGMQYVSLISPVFSFVLIYYVSGVRMLEARSDKKWGSLSEYQDYKKSVPILVPKL